MTSYYRATGETPALVQRALDLEQRLAFKKSCLPEVGRLLRVLANRVRGGNIGEIGAGCGVGAAWIASGLAPGAVFVTVELNVERAQAVADLLAAVPQALVLEGDWQAILAHAPFDLLFVDARPAKYDQPELVVEALRPGGMVLLDDLTPEDQWPPEWRGRADPLRQFWLNDPRLSATELLVTQQQAVILATRL